ncbi:hypothetical protein TrVE_jg2105 [Triparma verrucosa]|uniref:Dynein heavy chain n=1 Tax=Triparma verrucosa TaxID=1606542 RepID=A0A9W7F3P5_9STRA|nr:hypothetical protein TrVE_jg2105 [Triparma verrucosa]
MATSKAESLASFKRVKDPTTIDVKEIVPDRQLPEWIGRFQKAKDRDAKKKKKTGTADLADNARVDYKNMKKAWKTEEQKQIEEESRLRVLRNRLPESSKPFPYSIRQSTIAADSSVALYVSSQPGFCERKDFAKAEGKEDFNPEGKFFEEDEYWKVKPPDVPEEGNNKSAATTDDPNFLRLDISKLPLELFDGAEFLEKDKSPEEWLSSCPEGSAAKFDGKTWKWRKVKVDSYDEETKKYSVTFIPSNTTKLVSRMNLLFDSEDKAFWERRRSAASKLRDETKQRLRFDHFVSEQPTSAVRPVQKHVLKGIHQAVRTGLPPDTPFPTGDNPLGQMLLRSLTGEVIQSYTRSMKEAIVNHLLRNNKAYLEEYNSLRLPPVSPIMKAPENGKVPIPEPLQEYEKSKHYIKTTHYSSTREVLKTFMWLNHTWDSNFSNSTFMDVGLEKLTLPTELEAFEGLQNKYSENMNDQLSLDWRRSFTEQLVDNVQDVYDFFQSSKEIYAASSLARLFKHSELRMAQQLRETIQRSVQEFAALIEKYCQSEENKNDDLPNLDSRKGLTGHSALLKTSVVVGPELVELSPSANQIEKAFIDCIDRMVKVARGLVTVDCDLMSLLHLPPRIILDLQNSSPTTIVVDEMIKAAKESIKMNVTAAMVKPQAVAEEFNKYHYLVEMVTADFVESFNEGKLIAEKDLDKGIPEDKWEKYTDEEYFSKVRDFHDAAITVTHASFDIFTFNLVSIDTTESKKKLSEKALDIRDALLERVVEDCREECEDVLDEYESILARISEKPADEVELQALRDFIQESKTTVANLCARVDNVHAKIEATSEFCYNISEEDVELMWKIKGYPRKVEESTSEAMEALEADRVKMMDTLAVEKENFEKLLATFEADVAKCKTFSDYEAMEANFGEVDGLMNNIEAAEKQAENFNMREKVFGQPPTEYPSLIACKKEVSPFHKLWTFVSEFHTSRQEWLHGSFVDLNANEIDEQVTNWWKTSYKMSRDLEDETPGAAECAQKLRAVTTEFREHLPVIRSLASKALKDRHWEEISVKMSSPGEELHIEPDDELTLNWLLEIHIDEHIEEIQEVCVAAEKQYGLEKNLEAMKMEWNIIEFIVKEYKETGTCVVGGVDEIITLLDDHIVKTQTMRGSPFIEPIRSECEDWERKLKYAQSLLEEWIACQRTWMYLEPIFSSDDIMRQLPTEAKRYQGVDALWKKAMTDCVAEPNFMIQADPEKHLEEKFKAANKKLDVIQKGLADYLEMKRLYFPRFFFLSNDELLEILSQTKDPRAVQPHLNKAFEGIAQVRLEKDLKITQMMSAEGEPVPLMKPVDPESPKNKGNVEMWLLELQYTHWDTILDLTKASLKEYQEIDRQSWTLRWPAQVILAVSQIYWTQQQEGLLRDKGTKGLEEGILLQNEQLTGIINTVRGKISKLDRKTLGALTTIDVHARDTCVKMVTDQVTSTTDFGWIQQLRYYWETSWKDGQAIKKGDNTCVARIVNARALYGYEYLGNTMRLVITPLTDRCYRTMIGAIDLLYGGAPEGPAGTGKTETVKDLSKAVAIQCVVFNCSDGLDYLAMAKFFKGLAACGAWCCFDEFNRINVEVLSVIAQQILTITTGKKNGATKFHFEGSYLELNHNANPFITMNPGYAGRAELPDNLKALFRPCSMMVPDYAMISEIRLLSFGFEVARSNAQKLVKTLQLCSEQLSSQKHYDYGMRAVNSILVAAGNLREQLGDDPKWDETKIVLRSVNDVNLAKFTQEDLPLFDGITSDLFPGVVLPEADYGELIPAIEAVCEQGVTVGPGRVFQLEPKPKFVRKIIELYEMVCVRHGLCVVGQTGSGKSVGTHALAEAMTMCHEKGSETLNKTVIFTMNPKSILSGQLYGNFDDNTHEWSDGILAVIYRNAAKDTAPHRKWVLFDGPVDAVWIENMNTVLDDNKKLCLMSGEIIKMSDTMTMMFEAEDLQEASPATVSRLGIIFTETRNLGWQVLRNVWLKGLAAKLGPCNSVPDGWEPLLPFISSLFDWLFPPALFFVEKFCRIPTPVTDMECCMSLIRFMECFLDTATSGEGFGKEIEKCLEAIFIKSLVWSVGAVVDTNGRKLFNEYLHQVIRNSETLKDSAEHQEFLIKSPDYLGSLEEGTLERSILSPPCDPDDSVYSFSFDPKKMVWTNWLKIVTETFKIDKDAAFQSIVVPTIDTIRHEALVKELVTHNFHVLVTGDTGTGKSVSVKSLLMEGLGDNFTSMFLNFSAQTKANMTQDIIDSKLGKRRKGVFGPDLGNTCVIFVDDLNMPAKEEYGAQPPIEILRQWMDHTGWYDRKENVYRQLVDIQFMAAMGPPGGGRTQITQRYVRHFNLFNFIPFDDDSLKMVFVTILDWFLAKGFGGPVKQCGEAVVSATIDVYNTISANLLPTPAKSHYTFNLRDISKVFQGIVQVTSANVKDKDSFIRLWAHEVFRVFHDRLIDEEGRDWFKTMMAEKTQEFFNLDWKKVLGPNDVLIYGNFVDPKAREPKPYIEIADRAQLSKVMDDYLEDYNMMTSRPMSLVLFGNAIEHVARISRVIQQPSGNALLVGVGGSGRKSLSILATSIAEYELFQIEISKSYTMVEWREDIKVMMNKTGVENKQVVFLYDDTQIVFEAMLEDVSGILNTGEVANLLNNEDMAVMMDSLSKEAMELGINTASQSEMYAYFVSRCKTNLHCVLAMSPIGDAFRTRLRKFPALVNCCTIDWFTAWPEEALRSVAKHFLGPVDLNQTVKDGVIDCCVNMQEKVDNMSKRYLKEMGRYYYVTPTSYLMLISTFKNLLSKQRNEVAERKARYENGLTKILETQDQVDVMQQELTDLQPKLKEATIATDALLEQIAVDTKFTNEKEAVVSAEKKICDAQAAEAKQMSDECEADLAEALPALANAIKALKSLTKGDIVEVKNFKTPPSAVKLTLHAICLLMGVSHIMVKDPDGGTKKVKDFWEPSKKQLLADPRFLQNLENYDKDAMTQKMIDDIRPFIEDPAFDPDVVKKGSVAAAGMCKWVHAMFVYYRVNKVVGPKKAALAQAKSDMAEAAAVLAIKEADLKKLTDKLAELDANLKAAEKKKSDLQTQVTDCANKLRRAAQLISGLGGERDRWGELSKSLGVLYENVTGDVMLSSGVIAYLGPFTAGYRADAITAWSSLLRDKDITCAETFRLSDTLGDPVAIREWIINKLPNDSFSVDNAIMLYKSDLWPLMIDPQSQANKWIKKSEAKNSLKIVKLTQATFVRTIENGIAFGNPVLIENVTEHLDPILDPLLQKQIVKVGGVATVRLGDNTIEYDPNFKLYMTTKLSNPHYPPETCVKVNLLNFMATLEGLEDQMLGELVKMEEPELEAQREQLVLEDADNQRQLKEIEDTILHLLKHAEGNILDDEVLIDTLAKSKVTSNNIEEKVKIAAKTQLVIAKTREHYKPVAFHASNLFFCIADLANVDPMYQYSLEWFIRLFREGVTKADKTFDKQQRLDSLQDTFTYILYVNVCRSLFAKDKLLFSFLLCTKIMLSRGELKQSELRFFLQGSTALELAKPKPENSGWLSDKIWKEILALSTSIDEFKGFDENFTRDLEKWEEIFNAKEPLSEVRDFFLQERGEDNMYAEFLVLTVTKSIRPDVVVPSTMVFVEGRMGKRFIEIPQFDLNLCFSDSACDSPLVFVLTPGADPMTALMKLADEKGFGGNKLTAISLGQGQGPIAEEAIKNAADKGTWVCLQNCHLCVSWMPDLEKICEELSPERVDPKFRLWLTSEPSAAFPVFILQNGVKMTVEPPKGMRANLLGSYHSIEEEFLEGSARPAEFKKLLFSLCFFHATVRERRKFGPLGWNVQYVFSGPDMKISMDQLRIFIDDSAGMEIPYPALHYLTAECNYGGRVTDDKDRRCLANILDDFYCPEVQKEGYKFSPSGVYYAPEATTMEGYKEYIESLPMTEGPEVFGLHDNANISCALSETSSLLLTALSLQPRSSGGEGKGWGEILAELAGDIEGRLPPIFDMEKALLDFPVMYEESMNTVLTQELIRFNRLTDRIASTLKEVQRAIKGLVVMSGELEEMGNSMVLSLVPALWNKVSYPSLKPLGSWVNDFLARLKFLETWAVKDGKAPNLFWISGFFFTQAFITGTLQNYARKEKKPIDTVGYDFAVLTPDQTLTAATVPPEDGAYVHGFYLDGARWNEVDHHIDESAPRELFVSCPYIHLWPRSQADIPVTKGTPATYSGSPTGTNHVYACPVYKTSIRFGVLMTTGHSTNFVMWITLPMAKESTQKHWIKRGVAMLTQLDD